MKIVESEVGWVELKCLRATSSDSVLNNNLL